MKGVVYNHDGDDDAVIKYPEIENITDFPNNEKSICPVCLQKCEGTFKCNKCGTFYHEECLKLLSNNKCIFCHSDLIP